MLQYGSTKLFKFHVGVIQIMKKILLLTGVGLSFVILSTPANVLAQTQPQANAHITYPLSSVVKHSDGSTDYVYNVNGVDFTISVPPRNFNYSTASNAELMKFGLPPKPAASEGLVLRTGHAVRKMTW